MGSIFQGTYRNHDGFTIVELLIVVVVIAILAAIVIVAYNGVANRASDSSAQSNIQSAIKKVEVEKINTEQYPLTLASINVASSTSSDIRTEYNSDGKNYCITASSIRAKTDYYKSSTTGSMVAGKCPNHAGYQGGAGTFSASSIFGANAPTGSYQVYNDGGGDLWVGNRFYTYRDAGVRVVGARFWEPASASAGFLSSPLSVRAYTQDWQNTALGGWSTLGSPVISKTYSGTRTAGTWTYVWFDSATSLAKITTGSGANDALTIAVRYDGNNYVAGTSGVPGEYIESAQLPQVYFTESDSVGRSVSNVYPSSANYYYGIDLLVTAN